MTELQDWLNATTPGHYRSYLVRIWQTDPQSGWRAMVVQIDSGTRYTFTDLTGLYRFLGQSVPPQTPAAPAGSSEISEP